ncbi:hypothetical protein OAV88_01450 [bacterium]|nr:hypothetical protein [bacterium]
MEHIFFNPGVTTFQRKVHQVWSVDLKMSRNFCAMQVDVVEMIRSKDKFWNTALVPGYIYICVCVCVCVLR